MQKIYSDISATAVLSAKPAPGAIYPAGFAERRPWREKCHCGFYYYYQRAARVATGCGGRSSFWARPGVKAALMTLPETIAVRLLSRHGIGVIWQLHVRAAASRRARQLDICGRAGRRRRGGRALCRRRHAHGRWVPSQGPLQGVTGGARAELEVMLRRLSELWAELTQAAVSGDQGARPRRSAPRGGSAQCPGRT